MSNLLTAPSTTTDELDRLAWSAICDWPKHSAMDTRHERLDYGLLTRSFLWDKVPRAIRYSVDPETFAFERSLLEQQQAQASRPTYPEWKKQLKRPFQLAERAISGAKFKRQRAAYSDPVLFIPRQHRHLRSTLSALAADSNLRLVAPLEHGDNPWVSLFQTPPKKRPDTDFARQLYSGLIKGLQAFNIELLAADQKKLRQQIFQQSILIRQVEAELAAARPQAVLVFADTHAPLQEYVAIANRENIPTILLQHGLDCEQYCLNEVQSAVVAVWGQARKQRYQQTSQHQPVRIEVTGNPEYDQQRLPDQLHIDSGDRWLWTTRPHGSHKCLMPSRSPHEGIDILEALLLALKQHPTVYLTVKPHPLDYIDLYVQTIEQYQLSDRVSINREPLLTVLPHADIVISEDSTAAMEAMFFGKVVIHAHFAASPPVLPLVEYAAALPAYSAKELQESLERGRSLALTDQETMLKGQHRFVYDYGGALDGQACANVTALISQVVTSTHHSC